MDELSELYDVHALERHSPGVYIVRISDALDIDSISNHEDVRWIGPYEPFMRTTSDVLGAHLVQIVLASDIQISDTPMLSADLIRYGATTAWCSIDMCEAAYESGMDSLNLRKIASHEDVMFVQRAFSLSLHNNIAATEVGGVAVEHPLRLALMAPEKPLRSWTLESTMTILICLAESSPLTHSLGSIHLRVTPTVATVHMSS